MDIQQFLIYRSRDCDFIPLVSTLSNGVTIVVKIALGVLSGIAPGCYKSLQQTKIVKYLDQKGFVGCILLMIPLINYVVAKELYYPATNRPLPPAQNSHRTAPNNSFENNIQTQWAAIKQREQAHSMQLKQKQEESNKNIHEKCKDRYEATLKELEERRKEIRDQIEEHGKKNKDANIRIKQLNNPNTKFAARQRKKNEAFVNSIISNLLTCNICIRTNNSTCKTLQTFSTSPSDEFIIPDTNCIRIEEFAEQLKEIGCILPV